MLKDELIRFLKDNHALKEFREEISPIGFGAFFYSFGAKSIYQVICKKSLKTDIDWKGLDHKWAEKLKKAAVA